LAFGWETVVACAVAAGCLAVWPRALSGSSREWFLAAFSAVLLWVWQPLALAVTLALTGLAWLALRHGRQDPLPRMPAAVAVTLLVGTLVAFKYLPGASGWAVPLGLSFTVFRLIGVILDVNALRIPLPLSRLFALSLFFPTLPAGPITTVRSFRELGTDEPARAGWSQAGWRIVQGLARKFLLADPLYALVVGPWLGIGVSGLEPYQCLVLPVLLGLYVYWDFAGYSDIAIGMGRLVGYEVPENFDRPYASRSIIEFWRRWHITLSEWIRGRLMMKMAGRRPTLWRLHGATLASMALCGLWHGAGPGFLVWGLWHGLGLVVLHLFSDAQRRNPTLRSLSDRVLGDTVSTALTFAFVTIGWTFFFLSPADALTLLATGLSWRAGSGVALAIPLLVLGALVLAHLEGGRLRSWWPQFPALVRLSGRTVLLGILAYALFLTSGGGQGFFYAQF
jgi:alginate O-acetyltransferase complex protein AlgI